MKVKKAIIKAYYNLDGEYLSFPDNPLHGQTYENVNIDIKQVTYETSGIEFVADVVEIEGQEPIECELVGCFKPYEDTLIIKICQDWG